jgi:hypothetical protein
MYAVPPPFPHLIRLRFAIDSCLRGVIFKLSISEWARPAFSGTKTPCQCLRSRDPIAPISLVPGNDLASHIHHNMLS